MCQVLPPLICYPRQVHLLRTPCAWGWSFTQRSIFFSDSKMLQAQICIAIMTLCRYSTNWRFRVPHCFFNDTCYHLWLLPLWEKNTPQFLYSAPCVGPVHMIVLILTTFSRWSFFCLLDGGKIWGDCSWLIREVVKFAQFDQPNSIVCLQGIYHRFRGNGVTVRDVPCNLGHLNTWFPVVGGVWGGLDVSYLFEKVSLETDFRLYGPSDTSGSLSPLHAGV